MPDRPSRARRFSRRQIVATAVGAAVVVLILLQLRPSATSVETGPVTRGALRVTVDEEGVTRVRDRFVVSAPITGRLERLALRAGDPVSRGTVVARLVPASLDPRSAAEAQAALAGARAALREAEAALPALRAGAAQARRDAERARTLMDAGAVAERDAEEAALRLTEAERAVTATSARVSQLRAEVRRAAAVASPSANVGTATVTAPASGRVLRVIEQDQRVVAAGSPILELGDPNDLEIVVDLRSEDAVQVRPGAPMLLEEWGGANGEPLVARVRTVEPAAFTQISALGVEEQRVNVVGDLAANPPALGDGFRVGIRIVVWETPNTLRVPTGALFRTGAGWSVFVVEAGRARLRLVQIGRRSPEMAEVLEGLQEGEQVILHPSDQLSPGMRVRSGA